MKVLFLTQTSELGASARYRVYQYAAHLKAQGIQFDIIPAVPDRLLNAGSMPRTFFYGWLAVRRLVDLFRLRHYDVVFMQRDMIVHLYPLLEKIAAVINPNMVFDFDDAIYLYPANMKPGTAFKFIWDRKKIGRIIRYCKSTIVGNNYLKAYALNFSDNVTLIPTSIDLNNYPFKKATPVSRGGTIKIGWVGSQGNFHYLENILPALKTLTGKYAIELMVIGAKGPIIDGMRITYKEWSLKSEIADISDFDIGLMPLTDDAWSKGKSATKLLQYMASGVPSVSSPVGANSEIVRDGVNGFLAKTGQDWIEKISILIDRPGFCRDIINSARFEVERNYSIQANAGKFIGVIEQAAN